MGSSGGGGTTTVTNQASPEQSQAFQFRLNQAQSGIDNLPGGAGYFTAPGNSPYQVNPQMQHDLTNLYDTAKGHLPPDPTSNWAMQAYAPAAQQYWDTAQGGIPTMGQWNQGANALAGYLGTGPAQMNGWQQGATLGAQEAMSPINIGTMNRGAAGVDYQATGASYDPVGVGSQAPVDVQRIDPARAYQAAQQHLATISSPEIRNALQAAGMGRSGAEAEGLAREGVRLQLPIEQQVLQSDAQANQLTASIKARQEEVQLLEEQKAKLQAQSLTATSREMAQQINGQLAGIEAQIQGRLSEAEFMGQMQASIAQRTSELGYASNTLGQLAGMNTAQYQTGAQVGTSLLGQLAGMGTAQYQGQLQAGGNILNNLTTQGLQIPNLQNQAYLTQLQGAQTQLQASSLPQQMQMQNWQNQQNYILSLLGASPLPNQMPGGSQQTSQQPGALNYLGTAALLGSMAWPQGGGGG